MPNRLTVLARGIAALLALAVIEAGIPLGLLRFGALPDHLPSLAQAGTTLTSPDNGSLLLGAICLIGWLAWAAFTLAVLIETLAAVRRRGAPRIPTLGTLQHLAAGLVASIVLLLPATSGALTATAAPVPAAALHLPHTAGGHADDTSRPGSACAAKATDGWSGPVHQVSGSDENLWDLAQHYLGDGARWKQIADLNAGITQPDGGTLTPSTLQLNPGWTIRLPSHAHAAAPEHHTAEQPRPVRTGLAEGDRLDSGRGHHHAGPGQSRQPEHHQVGERVHVVRPGDTLSAIAHADLGNAGQYAQIAAANQRTVQPDGRHLADPDVIYPGWKLAIPSAGAHTPPPATAASSSVPAAPAPPGAPPVSAPTWAATAPAPTPTPTAAPTSTPSTSSSAAAPSPPSVGAAVPAQPTGAPSRPAAPATAPPQAASTVQAVDVGSPARLAAGITALLAAGLLGGYGVKRALQQRRRRPGETIAVPTQTSPLEHALVQLAEPPSAELLDRALRTLAHHLPADTPAPELTGARVTAAGVQLLADGTPLAPFQAGPGGWWQLDPAQALLTADEAEPVPAPYPLLATLGSQPGYGALLADLCTARTVLLEGTGEQVREVARSLALEAATSPWGQDVSVLCAGILDPDLPAISHTSRLQHVRSLGEAIKDLAELLLTAHQDDEVPMPWILVVADQADESEAWQLADLAARMPAAPIALVLPADGLDPVFPGAAHLDCANTDPQPSPLPDTEVVLQRVTESMYQHLLGDLRTTEQPARLAGGLWAQIPEGCEELGSPSTDLDPKSAAVDGGVAPQGPGGPTTPFLALAKHLPAASEAAGGTVPLPAARAGITVRIADEAEQPSATNVSHSTCAAAAAQGTPQEEDQQAPEILVLGPLDITGLGSSGRGRRLADLAAYLYLRPHRTAEAIAEAMNPLEPWSRRTVVARTSDLRKLLGSTPDGTAYLPRVTQNATYPKMTGVRCDWIRFLRLAERGLSGGTDGIADLEAALKLVRGRPFQGSNASWAMPEAQEMASRIVDVAHTAAVQRISTAQWDAARSAIGTGLDVEPTAERLYRDWITLEHRRGNRARLSCVVNELQRALRPLGVDMEPETERLIADIYARDQQPSTGT